jgi:voltage-gated potassium channel
MRDRGLPADLRQRVQAYLDFVWDEGLAVDEDATLSVLPPGLREEVALHLRRDLVRGVPLFADASEAFVREVALQMQSFVALPGDVLVRAGDRGHEMYFIGRGSVEVVAPGGEVYRTLGAGDFFGEIALVDDAERTATVRALAPSDLYVLDRALFERVAAGYPDVAATLREAATHRQHGDGGDVPS